MSEDTGSFFEVEQTISGVVRKLPKHSTTAVVRSNCLYAPAYSTLAIHVSGTATIVIKANPFGDATKDFTIKTVTATTQEVITSANYYLLDITANSGTVTAIIVPNED